MNPIVKWLGIALGSIVAIAIISIIAIRIYVANEADTKATSPQQAGLQRSPATSSITPTPTSQGSLPSFAKDEDYAAVRQKMLSAGWQPFKATGAQACSDSDRRCTGRPEMEACAGSGMANCRFLWQMNGKTVAILTVGEEAAFSGIDTTQTPVNTASGVHGAPLGSIVDAMAIKSSASHTNNSWEETAKIMGVTWNWPYHESGAYNSTMVGITKVGSDKNPNIGATEVTINGTRSFITDIRISIRNESLGIEAFGNGNASKIKTSCDVDSASYTVEFFKFEKPGYKPLYVSNIRSSGAGGGGGVELKVTYDLADALKIQPNPCNVEQSQAAASSQKAVQNTINSVYGGWTCVGSQTIKLEIFSGDTFILRVVPNPQTEVIEYGNAARGQVFHCRIVTETRLGVRSFIVAS